MTFLIDLYALDAARRPDLLPPSARRWMTETPVGDVSISQASLMDYGLSIGQLGRQSPDHAELLGSWIRHVVKPAFDGRILPVEDIITAAFRLPILPDSTLTTSLVAATALGHGLTIVSPHPEDYAHTGAKTYNPWDTEL